MMHYRAVKNRIACRFSSLKLHCSEQWFGAFMESLGCSQVEVDIYSEARKFVGNSEYRLEALMDEAPRVFDCSSLTKYLFGQKGIWIPRLSVQQRAFGRFVNKPRPGDLCFTKGFYNFYRYCPGSEIGHVGLYTDQNTVLHATSRHNGVAECTPEDFFAGTFRGYSRVFQENTKTWLVPPALGIETTDDIRWLVLKRL
jgi:cell wall-associated NlpC family hydrolase